MIFATVLSDIKIYFKSVFSFHYYFYNVLSVFTKWLSFENLYVGIFYVLFSLFSGFAE